MAGNAPRRPGPADESAGLPEEALEEFRTRCKHEIRVECNMEEFPYFRLSKKNARSFTTIPFAREVKSDKGGSIKQSWIVVADAQLGLPGPFDQDVYVAMEAIIDEAGIQPEGYVPFTCYRIAQLLGGDHSGRNYINIRNALTRMVACRITSKKAFYLRGEKVHISETFHLYDSVHFEERSNPKRSRAAFEYNLLFPCRWYLASRQQNYTKPLDLGLYRELDSPVAKRLYRYLDKRRYPSPLQVELDLFRLADALPLTPAFPSKIKQVLEEPHRQLERIGFVKGVQYIQIPRMKSWRVRYSFHGGVRQPPAVPSRAPMVLMLVNRGISPTVAHTLAERYADRIPDQVDAFDWLLANRRKQVQQNPAGYLRKAIEDNYLLPHGFITERERKEARARGVEENLRQRQREETRSEKQRHLKGQIEQIKAHLEAGDLSRLRKEAEDNLSGFIKGRLQRDRLELGALSETSLAAVEYELDRIIEQRYLNPPARP